MENVIIQTRKGMVIRQLFVEVLCGDSRRYWDGELQVSPEKFESIISNSRRDGLVVVDNRSPWKSR